MQEKSCQVGRYKNGGETFSGKFATQQQEDSLEDRNSIRKRN